MRVVVAIFVISYILHVVIEKNMYTGMEDSPSHPYWEEVRVFQFTMGWPFQIALVFCKQDQKVPTLSLLSAIAAVHWIILFKWLFRLCYQGNEIHSHIGMISPHIFAEMTSVSIYGANFRYVLLIAISLTIAIVNFLFKE